MENLSTLNKIHVWVIFQHFVKSVSQAQSSALDRPRSKSFERLTQSLSSLRPGFEASSTGSSNLGHLQQNCQLCGQTLSIVLFAADCCVPILASHHHSVVHMSRTPLPLFEKEPRRGVDRRRHNHIFAVEPSRIKKRLHLNG